MTKHVPIAALTALLLAAVGAASAQTPQPPRDGEFRKNTAANAPVAIACVYIGSAPTGRSDYGHCLRIGRLQVGVELYQLQLMLRNDKRIRPEFITGAREVSRTPEGNRAMLIPLNAIPLDNGQLRLVAYLVADIDDSGRVVALQLTGRATAITEQLPFSGIVLGSRQQLVVDTLGLPSAVKDVPQIKGKQWNYAPFPFSIEFVDGVVYSIRVERPTKEDLQRVFTPLSVLPE